MKRRGLGELPPDHRQHQVRGESVGGSRAIREARELASWNGPLRFLLYPQRATSSSKEVLGANEGRRYLGIQNKSSIAPLLVNFGGPEAGADTLRVPPGQFFEWRDLSVPTGAVQALFLEPQADLVSEFSGSLVGTGAVGPPVRRPTCQLFNPATGGVLVKINRILSSAFAGGSHLLEIIDRAADTLHDRTEVPPLVTNNLIPLSTAAEHEPVAQLRTNELGGAGEPVRLRVIRQFRQAADQNLELIQRPMYLQPGRNVAVTNNQGAAGTVFLVTYEWEEILMATTTQGVGFVVIEG